MNVAFCPECESFESKYRVAVWSIYEAVQKEFSTIGEKLRALYTLQDRRDDALETFYIHQKSHRTNSAPCCFIVYRSADKIAPNGTPDAEAESLAVIPHPGKRHATTDKRKLPRM
jgi:hypothetical protein